MMDSPLSLLFQKAPPPPLLGTTAVLLCPHFNQTFIALTGLIFPGGLECYIWLLLVTFQLGRVSYSRSQTCRQTLRETFAYGGKENIGTRLPMLVPACTIVFIAYWQKYKTEYANAEVIYLHSIAE